MFINRSWERTRQAGFAALGLKFRTESLSFSLRSRSSASRFATDRALGIRSRAAVQRGGDDDRAGPHRPRRWSVGRQSLDHSRPSERRCFRHRRANLAGKYRRTPQENADARGRRDRRKRRCPNSKSQAVESVGRSFCAWPLLLVSQVLVAAILVAAFLAPATVRLATVWSPPSALLNWVSAAGGSAGWLALGLSVAAAAWLLWGQRIGQTLVAIFAAALASIIALTVLRQSDDHEQAFHALMAGSCLAAWLLPLGTWAVNRLLFHTSLELANSSWAEWPARTFGVITVGLALWEYSAVASWWVVLAIAAIGAGNLVIAWREGRRGSMWIAALLIVFAAGVWWLDLLKKAAAMNDVGDFFAFLWFEVLVGAALAIVSVWAERRQLAGERSVSQSNGPLLTNVRKLNGIAYHRFAAWVCVVLLLLTTGIGLIADLMNESFAISEPLAWAACAAAAVTAAACLWDPAIRWRVACLYCVGLIAVGMYLDELDLHSPLFHSALANALAAYSLATSGLWSIREKLSACAARLHMPMATASSLEFQKRSATWEGAGQAWLVPANCMIGVGVLLLVTWIELTVPSFTQRMVAAYAVGAQAFAIGLLARARCVHRCNIWRSCGVCCLPSRLDGHGYRPISSHRGCIAWW